MSSKKLEGKLTISKTNGYNGQWIEISIRDENSGITFVEATLSLEDFAKAVTGQGALPTSFEVRNLRNVGLMCLTKPLVFELKGKTNEYKAQAEARCDKEADPGWIADGYYRSQTSIQHRDGKTYAHGFQRRFVEPNSDEHLEWEANRGKHE